MTAAHKPQPAHATLERRQGWDPDYTGPERRGRTASRHLTGQDLQERYIAQQFGQIEDRLSEGDSRMQSLEQQVQAMRAELARNSEITEDIREVLTAGKMGLKVLGGIGVAAKWLGMLATAAVAIYGAWYAITHEGRLPPGR